MEAMLEQLPEAVAEKVGKVFIALPIYQDVDPLFFLCCLRLQEELNARDIHGIVKPWLGDSAVGRARNRLTREFLKSDCTHMLFIDSDLVFGGAQIARIMAHDEPIVGGVYCKKQEGPVAVVMNSMESPTTPRTDGLHQVKYVGTGFIRVAREVFEDMISRYGDELGYLDDSDKEQEYDFWQMGVYQYPDGSRRWLSEDWYFCQRAMDLGYKVWADTGIVLKHSGRATYPLSYQEQQLYARNK